MLTIIQTPPRSNLPFFDLLFLCSLVACLFPLWNHLACFGPTFSPFGISTPKKNEVRLKLRLPFFLRFRGSAPRDGIPSASPPRPRAPRRSHPLQRRNNRSLPNLYGHTNYSSAAAWFGSTPPRTSLHAGVLTPPGLAPAPHLHSNVAAVARINAATQLPPCRLLTTPLGSAPAPHLQQRRCALKWPLPCTSS
jgi:hypothetical protein